MKQVKNKHIVVIGAKRSGVAAARLLDEKGADVFVSDSNTIAEHFKKQLLDQRISFEEKGHTAKAEAGAFAVVSPGVPTQSPPIQAYLNAGKEVFSEIELASWFNKGSIVAVTGSNGKTTVTNWLDHIWSLAKKDHITAGNVGNAFSASVEESDENKDTILEVSSFQLDHSHTFHPRVSLLLNITPDHLDRYDHQLKKYVDSKFRILKNQNENDWLIYHYDDPIIADRLASLKKKDDCRSCSLFHQVKSCPKELLFKTNTLSLN